MKPGPLCCPTCDEPVGPDLELMLHLDPESTMVRVMVVNDDSVAAAMRDHLLGEHQVFPADEVPTVELGISPDEMSDDLAVPGRWATGYRSGFGAGRKGRQ